ncbi:hypothetical protein T484DRAFT_1631206, partial [Baffinella frigidus]
GSRVSGLGFRVSGLGSRVQGLGPRVSGLESRVQGLGFRVSGFGSRVSGLGFRTYLPYRLVEVVPHCRHVPSLPTPQQKEGYHHTRLPRRTEKNGLLKFCGQMITFPPAERSDLCKVAAFHLKITSHVYHRHLFCSHR